VNSAGSQHDDFQRLLSALVEEELAEEDRRRLAEILERQPDLRRRYVQYLAVHSWLEWDVPPAEEPDPPAAGTRAPTPTAEMPKAEPPSFFPALWDSLPAGDYLRSPRATFWMLFVVGCIVFWGTFFGMVWSMRPDLHVAGEQKPEPVEPWSARLTYVERAVWAGGSDGVPEQGKYYNPGETLELQSGLAA